MLSTPGSITPLVGFFYFWVIHLYIFLNNVARRDHLPPPDNIQWKALRTLSARGSRLQWPRYVTASEGGAVFVCDEEVEGVIALDGETTQGGGSLGGVLPQQMAVSVSPLLLAR